MCGDQFPSLPGKKRRQIPGVYPGGDVEVSIWLVHNSLTEAKIEDELIMPVQSLSGRGRTRELTGLFLINWLRLIRLPKNRDAAANFGPVILL